MEETRGGDRVCKVVSLFSGIGGIDLGFINAGFDIVWANERDHAACKTYRHNLGSDRLVEGDIRNVDTSMIPCADVLTAGFPCQSFSIGGAKRGFCDPRGQLFFQVIRVAETVKPKIIFLENVENLLEHDEGKSFQAIYTSLAKIGYIVHYRCMPTHEYANIPQTRRRIYIVASDDIQFSQTFKFPEPIPLTTKIGDLLDRKTKQPDLYYFRGESSFEKYIRSTVTSTEFIYRAYHGQIKAMQNRKCPTLTASMYSPQNAVLVKDDYGVRRLTLRECLRFQGFPHKFYFPKSISMEDAYRQIGNSVTVPLIKRIALSIHDSLGITPVDNG